MNIKVHLQGGGAGGATDLIIGKGGGNHCNMISPAWP